MTIENPDLIESEETVTLSKRRRELAIDANGEIEQLCTILKGAIGKDFDYMGASGIVSRIKFLSQKSMGLLSDTQEKTEDIAQALQA